MNLLEALDMVARLGIPGLLFVMWWYERKDKHGAIEAKKELQRLVLSCNEMNTQLVAIVKESTEASVQNTNATKELRREIERLHAALLAPSSRITN